MEPHHRFANHQSEFLTVFIGAFILHFNRDCIGILLIGTVLKSADVRKYKAIQIDLFEENRDASVGL